MQTLNNRQRTAAVAVAGTTIVKATLNHQEALAMGYLGGSINTIAGMVARGATVTEFAATLGTLIGAAITLGALHFGRRTLLGAPAAPPTRRPPRRPPRRPSQPPITRRPRPMR